MAESVRKHSLNTFAATLVSFVLSLGIGIITARALGPNDRGIFALVAVLPHTVVALVKLGMAQGSIYEIKRKKTSASLVASTLLMFTLIGTAVALPAMYLLKSEAMLHLLKGAPLICFLFCMISVPFLLIESYYFGILQAIEHFSLFNRRRLLGSALNLVAMFLALVIFKGRLIAALVVTAATTAAMDIWLIGTVHRLCGLRLAWDGSLVKRLLKFGVKSHLQSVATHMHFRADVYLVAGILTPSDVAFYSIATRLAELILFVPESLGTVIYPRQAESGQKKLEELTATSCRHVVFTTVLTGIALLLLGPFLVVWWYGSDYAPAGAPLFYLVPGLIMMSLFFILSRNFTSQNRQGINILASGVALGSNMALNWYLIPYMNISGAGLATLVSYSLATAILAVVYLRESGKRLRDLVIIRAADLQVYRRLLQELLGRRTIAAAAGVRPAAEG